MAIYCYILLYIRYLYTCPESASVAWSGVVVRPEAGGCVHQHGVPGRDVRGGHQQPPAPGLVLHAVLGGGTWLCWGTWLRYLAGLVLHAVLGGRQTQGEAGGERGGGVAALGLYTDSIITGITAHAGHRACCKSLM